MSNHHRAAKKLLQVFASNNFVRISTLDNGVVVNQANAISITACDIPVVADDSNAHASVAKSF
jgi:hypothetical protein